ncbi:hypothetical protein SERLADRAFT_474746 [Serpula lacrymans var. lacrymans S7.9]|uniref:DUF6697 domain-containing protein n=1 Tax=Serpula lacrymans var. lacrymans (strain S7.9) TaxID=578457 RepID=F8P5D2_SERL9|nr:uncharacterized protein SERLADRAFT_474746 [Serpula lacrymans var. lacrymans S7.9]EGO21819.1 hypothetical protein SERLADRAFT_474746 [Serpula lacrymans var. lacrymans S7.9]
MSTINVDAYYGPELVEFWAHKYKKVKEEFEEHKRATETARKAQLSAEYAELLTLVRGLHNGAEEASIVRRKLELVEREKVDLTARMANVEAERTALAQQIQLCVAQASAFAAEADQHRRNSLSLLFPPVSFVDPNFEPSPLLFTNPTDIISSLEPHFSEGNRLYFLPRPPACMPLRVPACGQPGYWFYPNYILSEDTEFDLVVEGRPGEWSYLGNYVTALFPGGEMKISEWMNLDEQTKMTHCSRVATENSGLPAGQSPSYPDQITVKRRYELGEWRVPCYSLRCVGFNMPLYEALHVAATKVMSAENANTEAESGSADSQSAPAKPQTVVSPTLQIRMFSPQAAPRSSTGTGGGKRRRTSTQRSGSSSAEDLSLEGTKKRTRTFKVGNIVEEKTRIG